MAAPGETSNDGRAGGRAQGEYRDRLFVVHSHLTYLVARAVVHHENLDPGRVALLAPRSLLHGDSGYQEVPVSYAWVPDSGRERRRILEGWRRLSAIDEVLYKLTQGHPFHLYTPQTLEHLVQILRTSRLCAGFSYIEEGLNSYCTLAEIERTHPPAQPRVLERVAYRNRIRGAHFFDKGYCRAYGLHPEAFPDMQERVVLDDVFPNATDGYGGDVENVLVFDALSVRRRVRWESVVTALRRLFAKLRAEGVFRVHYKLHPAQLGSGEVHAIEGLFSESGLTGLRLPDGLCLEALAKERPHTRYFVNLSSVGLYAALFGCPTLSYAMWVADAEPSFASMVDLTPQAFKNSVEFLVG